MKKEAINMFIRHKRKLQIAVGLVMFVAGFLFSWKFLCKPLTNDQFKLCEQVAQDVAKNLPETVYASSFYVYSRDNLCFKVTTDKNSITVGLQDFIHREDKVVSKRNGDTSTPIHQSGFYGAVYLSILFGGIMFVLGLLIVNSICIKIRRTTNNP